MEVKGGPQKKWCKLIKADLFGSPFKRRISPIYLMSSGRQWHFFLTWAFIYIVHGVCVPQTYVSFQVDDEMAHHFVGHPGPWGVGAAYFCIKILL